MKKIFASIYTILLFNSCVLCQAKIGNGRNEFNGKENKAMIYIKAECEEKENIRFRLFNNTNWAIAVPTFSFYLTPDNVRRAKLQNGQTVYLMPNNKEISSLFYFTEKEQVQGREKSLILGGRWTDSFNYSWIGSKDFIFFSIPKAELKDNAEVFVLFNYEWELNERGMFFSNEVQHRIYFRFPDYNNPQQLSVCSNF